METFSIAIFIITIIILLLLKFISADSTEAASQG
jgi:hypothetical protein